MTPGSRHISTRIDRLAAEVYSFASDPANLPAWASGLGSSVELVNGRWTAESPMGTVTIDFAAQNDLGVLDHDLTLPSGESVYNPMRVFADGAGCEVVFTLRRRPEMTDEEFEGDATAVAADLEKLRQVLENR
ncbi:MAG: SRPBCC family protein [Arachnia sp.]